MLTDAQIATYQTTGALLLKGAFAGYVDGVRAAIEENQASPSWRERTYRPDNGGAPFFQDYVVWDQFYGYRALVRQSPMPEIAAGLMQSKTARIFHDHILVKEPGSSVVTPWHQDQPYYLVRQVNRPRERIEYVRKRIAKAGTLSLMAIVIAKPQRIAFMATCWHILVRGRAGYLQLCRCQPAPSRMRRACAPDATVLAISVRAHGLCVGMRHDQSGRFSPHQDPRFILKPYLQGLAAPFYLCGDYLRARRQKAANSSLMHA